MALAYDGSAPAENALTLAADLSARAAWPLSVVIITDDQAVAAELSDKTEAFLETRGVERNLLILKGKEDKELVKFIREGTVDLLVMGAYGHNRLRELILGSTTSSVIRKSTIPVLLTR
jgi:nucleotide-binding universal stress UspA family protein